MPALPPPGADGSHVSSSSRDSRDFDGSADWVKGVIGEAMLPVVFACPSAFDFKPYSSNSDFRRSFAIDDAGLCMADMAM